MALILYFKPTMHILKWCHKSEAFWMLTQEHLNSNWLVIGWYRFENDAFCATNPSICNTFHFSNKIHGGSKGTGRLFGFSPTHLNFLESVSAKKSFLRLILGCEWIAQSTSHLKRTLTRLNFFRLLNWELKFKI